MTEPKIPFANPADESAAEPTSEARHSWQTAGRNAARAELDWVPGTKLDWAECLPFPQVRGVEVAPGPDHPFPGVGAGEP